MTFVNSTFSIRLLAVAIIAILCGNNLPNCDAQVTLENAMSISPRQNIDYEKPGISVLKKCKLSKTTKPMPTGFVVHHESGRILRQFLDNNGDGKLDQWSYYKDGIEVYRDLDMDFDQKADQYRWLGEAGTRWGIDGNEDGTIDSWKVISAEEVAFEAFQAIKNLDQERFNRLLITPEEFQKLQLGENIRKDVSTRWTKARKEFLTMARSQKAINSKAKWVYAGNGQAGMSPAGAHGNKTDLIVYDHGSGFFDSNGVRQLGVGSIVRVGDVWRLIELPEVVDPKKPLGNGGAFFPMPEWGSKVSVSKENKALADAHDRLAEIEKRLQTASSDVAIQKAEKDKADVLALFYGLTKDPKMKRDWLENLADSVSSAYQSDRFEDGLQYLDTFARVNQSKPGMDYVKWRAIFADYGRRLKEGSVKKERDKAFESLIGDLKVFQKTYQRSPFAADALIQLAVHYEVRNTDEPAKAQEWYKECLRRFPNTSFGNRAKGAMIRLSGMGNTFAFQGKTLENQIFNIEKARGKIVVLHYWETWCADGFDELKKIKEKFPNVVIVSCNIDQSSEDYKEFISDNKNKIPWIKLHQPGTVDNSPLAHQLGVATLPMVVLVDKAGKLVDTNIAFGDLEREIVRENRRK